MATYNNKSNGVPFFSGQQIPWTFAAAHPIIRSMKMHVIKWQGYNWKCGQDKTEYDFTEANMPSNMSCASCGNGGINLSRYVAGLTMSKIREKSDYINCYGRIGASLKGRNQGQQCSVCQFTIKVSIIYHSNEIEQESQSLQA